MSALWQPCIDECLVRSGNVGKGAIIGTDGVIWAKGSDFDLSFEEANSISRLSPNPRNRPTSLNMAGSTTWIILRMEDVIYVRKGQEGACIAKGGTCIIIGHHHAEKTAPGACNVTVESLREYLMDCGY